MLLLTMGLAAGQVSVTAAPSLGNHAGDRIVCVEHVPLGSRIPGRRVCRPASAWEQDRRNAQDAVDQAVRLNLIHDAPAANAPVPIAR